MQVKIAQINGIQLILNALVEHPQHQLCTQYCCWSLKNLCLHAENKVKIVRVNGYKLVVQVCAAACFSPLVTLCDREVDRHCEIICAVARNHLSLLVTLCDRAIICEVSRKLQKRECLQKSPESLCRLAWRACASPHLFVSLSHRTLALSSLLETSWCVHACAFERVESKSGMLTCFLSGRH